MRSSNASATLSDVGLSPNAVLHLVALPVDAAQSQSTGSTGSGEAMQVDPEQFHVHFGHVVTPMPTFDANMIQTSMCALRDLLVRLEELGIAVEPAPTSIEIPSSTVSATELQSLARQLFLCYSAFINLY